MARGGPQPERLDVPGRLAQATVLVEVAAHELDRAVVVGMEYGCAGLVDLAPARREHVDAERLVLGVADVAKADLLPAGARVAGVDVREERRVAVALERPGCPSGEKPAKNSLSSRAIIGLVSGRGRCGP